MRVMPGGPVARRHAIERDHEWRVVVDTHSPERTRAVGADVAAVLRGGDVVLVAGELGAGKTTLVQGIAAGLGVAEPVTSPTFTLVRPYPCHPGSRDGGSASSDPASSDTASESPPRVMLHADLYRLDRLGEVADLALGELVEESAVAVVEWGDVADAVLGRDALRVVLEPGAGDDDRRITIAGTGSWAPRWDAVSAAMGRRGERGTGRFG